MLRNSAAFAGSALLAQLFPASLLSAEVPGFQQQAATVPTDRLSAILLSRRGYSPLCQSVSRVKLILGLSGTSKVEDLWTTRLGTAYANTSRFH
jgi:hypothetical protein